MYETMLKQVDHFPESLTYMPSLPAHLRQRVFRYLEGPLPESAPGKIMIRPLFEKILAQILAKDYGNDNYPLSPMKVSLRCACLGDLIYFSKFCSYLTLKGLIPQFMLECPIRSLRTFSTVIA